MSRIKKADQARKETLAALETAHAFVSNIAFSTPAVYSEAVAVLSALTTMAEALRTRIDTVLADRTRPRLLKDKNEHPDIRHINRPA